MRRVISRAGFLLLISGIGAPVDADEQGVEAVVMIVSGHVSEPIHKPNTPGALSYSGRNEYEFNDAITRMFEIPSNQLQGVQYVSLLATENKELKERSRLANRLSPDLYIEIHHDSAKQSDRDLAVKEGAASPLWQEMRGFSVHYSEQSVASNRSKKFSELLGGAMLEAGFTPNHYLANRVGMKQVDSARGIYNRIKPHGLYIFRAVRIPIVVLEAGNIANPHEESKFSQQPIRSRIVKAINNAIERYFDL